MLKIIKTRAVWMAVGIVLGGSALSFAGVAATSSHGPKPEPTVSESPEPSVSETPEPSDTEAADPADNGTDQNNGGNEQHPINHGFYVSQAAHCKDVNDTVNHISFTAPADCATNGKAHGDYVRQVAQSGVGKGAHGKSKANIHKH